MRLGIGGGGRIIRGGASIGRGGVRGGVGVGPFSLSGGTRGRRRGGGGGGGGGDGEGGGQGFWLLVAALLLLYGLFWAMTRLAGRIALPGLVAGAVGGFTWVLFRRAATRRKGAYAALGLASCFVVLFWFFDVAESFFREKRRSVILDDTDHAYEFFHSFVIGATWARWAMLGALPVVLVAVLLRWRYPTDAKGTTKGWMADPTGRHQHRYWNGRKWTHHVADSGAASTDAYQWWSRHRGRLRN